MCTQYKWPRCPTIQMTIMSYNTNDYAVPLQTHITLRNLLHNVLGLTHNCIIVQLHYFIIRQLSVHGFNEFIMKFHIVNNENIMPFSNTKTATTVNHYTIIAKNNIFRD